MEEEIGLETVKGRAVKGVMALTSRTLVLRLIAFVAQGFLWAFLEPKHFGTFILVLAIVNFLSYFADIGLGAALIQKKERPTSEDFKTVFTVQECLVITVSLILFLISPILIKTYSLSQEGIHLLYALTISFFLASLKNIPSIILERKLEFGKFIIPQILEDLVYNLSVVYFAWRGLGITSFTYAVLFRSVVGVVAIYILQPWKPIIGISRQSLKSLLSFGVPYQLNNFLATLKDDGLTIVLGKFLGSVGLGILGTAQRASQYPLRFFMDNVNKVTFPAFSRMQNEKEMLSRAVNRSVFFICTLVFPSLVGLVILFPVILQVIPRYQKWAGAFIPLIFFSANSMIASFTTQFTNTLNAVGRIKTTFKLMVMWASLSWLLIPFLARRFGVNGASSGYFLVALSSFVVFFLLKKIIDFDFVNTIGKPLLSSLLLAIFLLVSLNFAKVGSFWGLIFLIFSGGLVYFLGLYLLVGRSLIDDVQKTLRTLFQK